MKITFEELRYFKRELPSAGVVPTASVANMTGLFGTDNETGRFVKRYLQSTHFDLFFADAIVVIEGTAERILLPHLIQNHYPDLAAAYLSFLELGGSHAHRMRPLIEALELPTLIITDLDAVVKVDKDGKTVTQSARPCSGAAQTTSNHVLKTWLPIIEEVDALMAEPEISGALDRASVEALTKPENYLGEAPEMVRRLLKKRGGA